MQRSPMFSEWDENVHDNKDNVFVQPYEQKPNRRSSERIIQTCLDYPESRRRKAKPACLGYAMARTDERSMSNESLLNLCHARRKKTKSKRRMKSNVFVQPYEQKPNRRQTESNIKLV